MTVETERLTGVERAALQDAWTALSRAVNPSAHLGATPPAPGPGPSWMTLEIAGPTRLPRLFWPVDAWQEQPASLPVRFEREELAVLVSDQPLHDPRTPPTSIARVVPATVGITEAAGIVTLTVGNGTGVGGCCCSASTKAASGRVEGRYGAVRLTCVPSATSPPHALHNVLCFKPICGLKGTGVQTVLSARGVGIEVVPNAVELRRRSSVLPRG